MNGNRCVEYFECVEYRIPAKQLCIKTCNNIELERLRKRRNLGEVLDTYARDAIIKLIQLELVKRGKISEAGLVGAVEDEFSGVDVKVYSNNTSLVVAVRTFFTTDCLLEK